jgi:hypothetical protein
MLPIPYPRPKPIQSQLKRRGPMPRISCKATIIGRAPLSVVKFYWQMERLIALPKLNAKFFGAT